MPRKAKNQLFGIFDEQAVSVMVVLLQKKKAKFGELLDETDLSRASLSRILNRLNRGEIVKEVRRGYSETQRGRRVTRLVMEIARAETEKAMANLVRRLRELEREYRADHRIYHGDAKWERTAEKPLMEVIPMRRMTSVDSLLFQQRFQEEAVREEQRLRSSPIQR
jgi:DNA-binding transcriptional ArsR family regulator